MKSKPLLFDPPSVCRRSCRSSWTAYRPICRELHSALLLLLRLGAGVGSSSGGVSLEQSTVSSSPVSSATVSSLAFACSSAVLALRSLFFGFSIASAQAQQHAPTRRQPHVYTGTLPNRTHAVKQTRRHVRRLKQNLRLQTAPICES